MKCQIKQSEAVVKVFFLPKVFRAISQFKVRIDRNTRVKSADVIKFRFPVTADSFSEFEEPAQICLDPKCIEQEKWFNTRFSLFS